MAMRMTLKGKFENGAVIEESGMGTVGLNQTAELHNLRVQPIPTLVAKQLIQREHYLHSLPGGTMLCFGIFVGQRLLGALTFGAGPTHAYKLVEDAKPDDCTTLTRLWLADELPFNSESRILGIVIRALHKYSSFKFLVAYSDPAAGHTGTIYQATNWLYTGLSTDMPLYDIGDGIPRHSRSLAHAFGSHSIRYFTNHGMTVELVPQSRKHRYIYFLNPTWRSRLSIAVLPYPKKENIIANH